MAQFGRPSLLPLVLAGACFLASVPAGRAVPIGVGGAGVIRREVHDENGGFRFTADLYPARESREPYWGYLSVSKELLLAPNVGRIEFGLVLVTPDGKEVDEARWAEDPEIPYGRWTPMRKQNGRWFLSYPLQDRLAGTQTIYFGGKIKGGKRSYIRLLWLSIGGRRRDKRQADARQFMIYRLIVDPASADPDTLVNAQESMGAGGKSLIGPRIREVMVGRPVRTRHDRQRLMASAELPRRPARQAFRSPQRRRGGLVYRVHLGWFESREAATRLRDRIAASTGTPASLTYLNGAYGVQAGAYRHREHAYRAADTLRSRRFRAEVHEETT